MLQPEKVGLLVDKTAWELRHTYYFVRINKLHSNWFPENWSIK